jgi:hypothetical protein
MYHPNAASGHSFYHIHFLKRPKSRVAQMAKIGALWSPSQRNKLNAVSDQSSAWFVQKNQDQGK